jgi:hypothetical protein
MNIEDPYARNFFPESILKGLEFYFQLLDRINIQIYIDKNFPIKRKDILITITFLKNIPKEEKINNLSQSHPQLTWAMESIEGFSVLSSDELSKQEMRVIIFLDHLLFSGINIMLLKAKWDLSSIISNLSLNERIKYLIQNKYYLTTNPDSFPDRYIKETVEYCNLLIEESKELRGSEESNSVNDEVKKMVESYLSQINQNIRSNDLISPLIEGNYEEFIGKLKRMLFIPSYFDIREEDRERMFHIYLLGLLEGRLVAYNLKSNKESGLGRFDIGLYPLENRNPGVIIEIKKIESTTNIEAELDDALQQIKTKYYSNELEISGIQTILNVAIVFDGLEPYIKYQVKTKSDRQ